MGMVKKSVMNMMNIMTKMSIEKIKNNVELAASLNLPVQLAVLVSEEDIIKYSSFGGSSLETLLVVLEYPWIASSLEKQSISVSGKITNFIPVNVEGNTHIYFALEGKDKVFDVDMTNTDLLDIVKYQVGDTIKVLYTDDDYPAKVVKIE